MTGGAPNLKDDQWHHVTFTYDQNGADPNQYAYFDGVTYSRNTGTSRPFAPSTLVVGHHQSNHLNMDDDQEWIGVIDEVRVWSRLITLAEVEANKNKVLTGDEEGLLAYYRFDDEPSANRAWNDATKQADMIIFSVNRVDGAPGMEYPEDFNPGGGTDTDGSFTDTIRSNPGAAGGVGAAVGLIASTLAMNTLYSRSQNKPIVVGSSFDSAGRGKGTGLSQVGSPITPVEYASPSNAMTQASSRNRSASSGSKGKKSKKKRSNSKTSRSRGASTSSKKSKKSSKKSRGSKDKRLSGRTGGTDGFYKSVVTGGPPTYDENLFEDSARPMSGMTGVTGVSGVSGISLASSTTGGAAAGSSGTIPSEFNVVDDRGTLSPAISSPLMLQSPDEQKANKRLSSGSRASSSGKKSKKRASSSSGASGASGASGGSAMPW